MGGITVDERLFPLVEVRPVGRMDEACFRAMFRDFEAIYRRGDPFAVITDTRGIDGNPPASVRKLIGEWHASTVEIADRLTVANYIVVGNHLIRGAIIALDWVQRPAQARIPVTDYREALAGCVRALEERNISVPTRLRDHALGPPTA